MSRPPCLLGDCLTDFGCVELPVLPGSEDLAVARARLDAVSAAGNRRGLDDESYRRLTAPLRIHLCNKVLPCSNAVAIHCTSFSKSPSTNWGVASHRDRSVP